MRHSGFSLVELSIVLVILGLLVGGILAGQSLIRASELRSVTTQHSRFITAIHSFRDKYFALPGDFTKATDFWGTAANCPGNASQGSTSALTCNGNGDGMIMTSAPNSNETYRFWQHLANAGLIEGTYSGVTGDDSYSLTTASTNSPSGKLNNSLWQIWHVDNSGAPAYAAYMWAINFRNHFILGGARSASLPRTPIMSPGEAWNIDTKMDDGRPGRGKVVSNAVPSASTGYCSEAASTSDFNAAYDLDTAGNQCFLVFPDAF